jgi:hypothetical protein
MPAQIEQLWEQILQYIEDGQVIPIVGKDLLRLQADGRQVLLDEYLARRLTEKLGVEAEGTSNGSSLNDVAGRYLAGGGAATLANRR